MGETDEFEWDDDKEASNVSKHGLSLLVAIAVFDDPSRIEFVSARSTVAETRLVTVGLAFGRLMSCVYAWRGRRRRLISMRPANRKERRAYEA